MGAHELSGKGNAEGAYPQEGIQTIVVVGSLFMVDDNTIPPSLSPTSSAVAILAQESAIPKGNQLPAPSCEITRNKHWMPPPLLPSSSKAPHGSGCGSSTAPPAKAAESKPYVIPQRRGSVAVYEQRQLQKQQEEEEKKKKKKKTSR